MTKRSEKSHPRIAPPGTLTTGAIAQIAIARLRNDSCEPTPTDDGDSGNNDDFIARSDFMQITPPNFPHGKFDDEPSEASSVEQVGEYLREQQRRVLRAETHKKKAIGEHTQQMWAFGKWLKYAKNKVPHGDWMAFYEKYGLNKNRVSEALQLFELYKDPKQLKGKSVGYVAEPLDRLS